ncbi:MAG: recombination protein RecR [Candidatus Marinimicrobia bacterium]|nr:recombination protein RecR [Candidatus Neomarinimicrobiota bacterium]
MDGLPPSLEKVVLEFSKFPGIGRKTAQRLGFHLLNAPVESVVALAEALLALKDRIGECSRCHNLSEQDLCEICLDPRRDSATICVVEKVLDVLIFERMGEYHGHYHVLGGVISPLDGITPEELHIDDLIRRLPELRELIIATPPNMEGDTTALFIVKQSEPFPVKITRLARGLPMGANLEFTDEATLASAYTSRVDL